MKLASSIGAFAVVAAASGVAKLGAPREATPIARVVLVSEATHEAAPVPALHPAPRSR